jgi:hypothetical protein
MGSAVAVNTSLPSPAPLTFSPPPPQRCDANADAWIARRERRRRYFVQSAVTCGDAFWAVSVEVSGGDSASRTRAAADGARLAVGGHVRVRVVLSELDRTVVTAAVLR